MPGSAAQRPTKLAESAFELFAARGFDEVTIDEIAAHVGVTKGSFYSHYKSKHEIVLAACSHYYRRYQRRIQEELVPLTDPAERLRRVLEISVRTCIVDERNRMFTTEIFALSLKDDQVRKGGAQFYDTVREMYVGLLMAAQASKQIGGADPRRAVDLMLAAIEGVKMRAAFEPHIADPDEQQSIIEGLFGIVASAEYEHGCVSDTT